jgi:hypothetical protein
VLQLVDTCNSDPVQRARLLSLWPVCTSSEVSTNLFLYGVSFASSNGQTINENAGAALEPITMATASQVAMFNSYGVSAAADNCAEDNGAEDTVQAIAVSRTRGLWALPSFVNHSCAPNANRLLVGDSMVMRATRPIAAGEEMLYFYTDISLPVADRQASCERWKFRCRCRRCEWEQAPGVEGTAAELVSKAKQLRSKGIAASKMVPVISAVAGCSRSTVCPQLFALN